MSNAPAVLPAHEASKVEDIRLDVRQGQSVNPQNEAYEDLASGTCDCVSAKTRPAWLQPKNWRGKRRPEKSRFFVFHFKSMDFQ